MAVSHTDVDVATPLPPAATPTPRRSSLDVRTIAEASLLMDVTVLLCLVRVFFPIPTFTGLIALACPLPFTVLCLRRGLRAGWVATIAAYLLLSTFVGPVAGVAILVYGGLGLFFSWASQRRVSIAVTVVSGACLYGVLYLLPPFLLGLLVLRVNLAKVLSDVHKNAASLLGGLGHLPIVPPPLIFALVVVLGLMLSLAFGSRALAFFVLTLGMVYVYALSIVPRHTTLLTVFSSFGLGRAALHGLYPIALALLTHPLITLIAAWAAYSLIKIWTTLIVTIELYNRLPVETRRTAEGERIDFFPVG